MRMHQPTTQTKGQYAGIPAHPEEIRAKAKFRVGKRVSLNARVRMMPAGRHCQLNGPKAPLSGPARLSGAE